ncbi:hypothetical protein J1614_002833 [Plenodomus biglobosus]|nr:hypothetical protein J1614_002833 [Plenodomus biglobosus]
MHRKRERLPSPVKQHILWSSPLKGMEQPVRSFKSFMRTVPPNPGIENQKPLPPIPSSPQSPEPDACTESPIIPSVDRGASFALWRAPTEWDWDISTPNDQPVTTTSLFPTRTYLPLIPEPSPGSFDMQGNKFAEILDTYESPRYPLDSGYVAMEDRPEPPPRNPSRLSFSVGTNGRSGSDSSTASVLNDTKSSLSPSIHDETRLEQSTISQLCSDVPNSAHTSYRASDASTKEKAFASLGIGSPRTSRNLWEDWKNQPSSSLVEENGPHLLVLRGKSLQPFVGSDLSATKEVEVPGLNDKLEQLSFSQDYHNVLAHHYHDSHSNAAEMSIHPVLRTTIPISNSRARAQSSRKDQEMVPRPLAWRKSSGSSSTSNESRRTPSVAELITKSRAKRMHEKMSSWVPLQHLYISDRGAPLHSTSGVSIPRVSPTRVTKEIGPKKAKRFPNLLVHAKGLRSHKDGSGPDNPNTITLGSSQQTLHPSTSPTRTRPLRTTTPLLRLPGGLELVRRSPSATPRSGTPNISYPTPLADAHVYDPYTGSPLPTASEFRRPSSSYSQSSASSPVAPGMAINSRMRNSICSLPSHRPYSSSSSLPTSPLAQEVFFLQTLPPPALPKKHPRTHHISPTTPPSPTNREKDQAERFFEGESAENSPHRLGLLDKARDVRDAWKRHQKEVKQEKLKQSIRVLGPIDVVGMERRSNREASVLVDSDPSRRLPESEYATSNLI